MVEASLADHFKNHYCREFWEVARPDREALLKEQINNATKFHALCENADNSNKVQAPTSGVPPGSPPNDRDEVP